LEVISIQQVAAIAVLQGFFDDSIRTFIASSCVYLNSRHNYVTVCPIWISEKVCLLNRKLFGIPRLIPKTSFIAHPASMWTGCRRARTDGRSRRPLMRRHYRECRVYLQCGQYSSLRIYISEMQAHAELEQQFYLPA
jgi:hypothetical protein